MAPLMVTRAIADCICYLRLPELAQPKCGEAKSSLPHHSPFRQKRDNGQHPSEVNRTDTHLPGRNFINEIISASTASWFRGKQHDMEGVVRLIRTSFACGGTAERWRSFACCGCNACTHGGNLCL